MTRHMKLLTMMRTERNGRVYNVIGQSKAPYKLSGTCPTLGAREHNTKTDDYDPAGDVDGDYDDDDGD